MPVIPDKERVAHELAAELRARGFSADPKGNKVTVGIASIALIEVSINQDDCGLPLQQLTEAVIQTVERYLDSDMNDLFSEGDPAIMNPDIAAEIRHMDGVQKSEFLREKLRERRGRE